jgi:hypothetical protein
MRDLLNDLGTMLWGSAVRTYGNAHSSLIGLFVHWWISALPGRRWALESGPSSGYTNAEQKVAGRCDALFGEDQSAVGLLEVEGSRHEYTARKLGHFFEAAYAELRSLEFAIFVAYRWPGSGRRYPPPLDEPTRRALRDVSTAYPKKQIVVITVDKRYERGGIPIRARRDYFCGTPHEIRGVLFQNGSRIGERIYHPNGGR